MMFEIQCRACLVITDLESSYHVEERRLLGKTLKEIILLFLPQMDTPSLIGDVICFNCYNILQSFSKFIEGCIEVESILNKIKEGFNGDCNKKCTSLDNKIIKSNSRGLQSQGTLCNNTQKEMVTQLNQAKIMNGTVESVNTTEQVSLLNLPNTSNIKTNAENCSTERKERNEVFTADTFDYDTIDLTNNDSKTDSDTEAADSEVTHSDGEAVYFSRIVGTGTSIDEVQLDSLNNYLVPSHDRVISVPQPTKILPTLIDDLSASNIEVFHFGKPSNIENKRVLLFGESVFTCPVCGVRLSNLQSFNFHISNVHSSCDLPKRKRYRFIDIVGTTKRSRMRECPICGKKLYTTWLLQKHMRLSHRDYLPYKCQKCSKHFRLKMRYENHIMLCKKFGSCNYRKCLLCNEMIDKVKFSQHMKEHNCFVCEQCGESFAKYHYLKMHEPKHKKKEGHLCPICGKLFTIRSNLGNHMKTHEENRERIYMCDKCPKSYMAEGRLNMHIRIVHEKKNQVECPKCKKKCSTKVALASHDRLKHSNDYAHTCHICQARFVRGDYFRRHMSSHAGSSNPNKHHRHTKYIKSAKDPVTCKYCLKVYKNIYLLRMHLLSHVKSMRHRCRYCSLTFSNAGNKYRHQRLHKNPNFDLRCKFCWKRMETKEELEEHVVKHDMSRKYDCKTCGELFASKYWLRHHISEKHTTMEDVEKEKAKVLQDALEEFLI